MSAARSRRRCLVAVVVLTDGDTILSTLADLEYELAPGDLSQTFSE